MISGVWCYECGEKVIDAKDAPPPEVRIPEEKCLRCNINIVIKDEIELCDANNICFHCLYDDMIDGNWEKTDHEVKLLYSWMVQAAFEPSFNERIIIRNAYRYWEYKEKYERYGTKLAKDSMDQCKREVLERTGRLREARQIQIPQIEYVYKPTRGYDPLRLTRDEVDERFYCNLYQDEWEEP